MAGGGIKINNIKVSGGADGKTPKFKIENGYLYNSYDNGGTWYELGEVKGSDGVDGRDGATGAKLVSQVLQGQDAEGGNIYLQTFDDDSTAVFVAPKGKDGKDAIDNIEIDKTLSVEGACADAKATGDALSGKLGKLTPASSYNKFLYGAVKGDNGIVEHSLHAVNSQTANTQNGKIAQYLGTTLNYGTAIPTGILLTADPTQPYHTANKHWVEMVAIPTVLESGVITEIKTALGNSLSTIMSPFGFEADAIINPETQELHRAVYSDNGITYQVIQESNPIPILDVTYNFPDEGGILLTDTKAKKMFVSTVETAWRIYGTRETGVQSVYTVSGTGLNGAIPQYSRNATLKSVGTPTEDNDLVNLKYLNDEGYLHYVNTTGYEVALSIKADNSCTYKIYSTQTPAGSIAVRDVGGVLRAKTLDANEWELMCINYGKSTLKDFILKGGNLIPIPFDSRIDKASDNPLEWNIDNDTGTITANGTALTLGAGNSGTTAVKLIVPSLRAGTYTYTLELVGGSSSKDVSGNVQLYNGNSWVKNFGACKITSGSAVGTKGSITVTLTDNDIPAILSNYNLRVEVYIPDGSVVDNLTVKPYLHAGNSFTRDATYGGGLVIRGQDLKPIAENLAEKSKKYKHIIKFIPENPFSAGCSYVIIEVLSYDHLPFIKAQLSSIHYKGIAVVGIPDEDSVPVNNFIMTDWLVLQETLFSQNRFIGNTYASSTIGIRSISLNIDTASGWTWSEEIVEEAE